MSALTIDNPYSNLWGLALTTIIGCSSETSRSYEMEDHVVVGLNIFGEHTTHLPPVRTVCIMKRWNKISKDVKSVDYSFVLDYEDDKDASE